MRLDVQFARLIDATPEEVFDAFTDSEGQEAFYGQDDPGWIVRSECDLRVGGVWTVDFGPSPRELYRHRHVFEVIERPHRLVLASTETRLDGSSFHTQLEFTFEARDGKTLMTMAQRGFPTAELREEHERGVPNAVARLERLILLSRAPTDARHDTHKRSPNVLLRSEQSDGQLSVIEATPGPGVAPPLHHHDFDEAFYVMEGHLTFRLRDEIRTVGPGDLVFAPRGVAHTYANLSDAPARQLIICAPAGFERYFARMAAEREGVEPPEWALQPIPEVTTIGPPLGPQAITGEPE